MHGSSESTNEKEIYDYRCVHHKRKFMIIDVYTTRSRVWWRTPAIMSFEAEAEMQRLPDYHELHGKILSQKGQSRGAAKS